MGRILGEVIVAVLIGFEFHDEDMGDAVLVHKISLSRIPGTGGGFSTQPGISTPGSTYMHSFGRVLLACFERLDVGLLGGGMQTVVFEGAKVGACLVDPVSTGSDTMT